MTVGLLAGAIVFPQVEEHPMTRRTLNDTKAIVAQPVLETTNPDYSGFRSFRGRLGGENTYSDKGGGKCVGNERLHHATQVLKGKEGLPK
jgi:hypothetical protein